MFLPLNAYKDFFVQIKTLRRVGWWIGTKTKLIFFKILCDDIIKIIHKFSWANIISILGCSWWAFFTSWMQHEHKKLRTLGLIDKWFHFSSDKSKRSKVVLCIYKTFVRSWIMHTKTFQFLLDYFKYFQLSRLNKTSMYEYFFTPEYNIF